MYEKELAGLSDKAKAAVLNWAEDWNNPVIEKVKEFPACENAGHEVRITYRWGSDLIRVEDYQ